MKLAVISAPNAFKLVDEFGFGYHLILAQKCLEDPKYREHYELKIRQGHFVILDNGAAELQHSIDARKVIDLGFEMGVDEICIPDALDDYLETMELFDGWSRRIPVERRLGIPQGADWSQWTACLNHMLGVGIATIGVAKRYERLQGGRAKALEIISETPEATGVHVHFLGCYDNPLREIWVARASGWVRGIDTAAPIAHAQQHLSMQGRAGESYGHISYDWGEPFAENYARDNIVEVLNACTLC